IAARKSGVLVEEFSIGMGPRFFKWQRGETVWSLRLLPIGGFCKMLGEEATSEDTKALNNKSVFKRAIIMAAGAIMNFVLAFLIFFLLAIFSVYAVPQIQTVVEGSPAEQVGLAPGDRILKIDGSGIHLYEDLSFALSTNQGAPIHIVYLRDGVRRETTLTPFQDQDGQYRIGFRPDVKAGFFASQEDGLARAGILESVRSAFFRIFFYIKVTFLGIIRLATLQLSVSDMSGPIGIVSLISTSYTDTVTNPNLKSTADAVASVIMTMANLCAILSANLGVFNLLPLPALDGGRLAFLLFEAIRRKPVPVEKEGFVHFVGFVLLMLLAAFIAYSDIRKML
ncbi:MAG: site-2 protease family protein, partial [Clostridiales bacterium]|nr:site-2 protease family protein [Clostridiales bacterium]